MMAVSAEHEAHVLDLFAQLGPVRIGRMFGGAAVYLDDACFATLLGDAAILMRGDDVLGPELEAAGGTRWVYERAGRTPVAMPYWSLPDSALDDPEEASAWARRALVPARAAAAEKAARKARKAAKATAAGGAAKARAHDG